MHVNKNHVLKIENTYKSKSLISIAQMAIPTSNPADTMPIKIQSCLMASILLQTLLNIETSIGLSGVNLRCLLIGNIENCQN